MFIKNLKKFKNKKRANNVVVAQITNGSNTKFVKVCFRLPPIPGKNKVQKQKRNLES